MVSNAKVIDRDEEWESEREDHQLKTNFVKLFSLSIDSMSKFNNKLDLFQVRQRERSKYRWAYIRSCNKITEFYVPYSKEKIFQGLTLTWTDFEIFNDPPRIQCIKRMNYLKIFDFRSLDEVWTTSERASQDVFSVAR